MEEGCMIQDMDEFEINIASGGKSGGTDVPVWNFWDKIFPFFTKPLHNRKTEDGDKILS
jgi:hypothetical protein